jgi:hypothetical protein
MGGERKEERKTKLAGGKIETAPLGRAGERETTLPNMYLK